ncbi:hypothetical protein A9Q94_06535 [Rhodobacterales bacterium 56_14_T64]|nr:hypothetical protein A9Q94_06535 [Rhodobacterales bacterium 56_14_T64]
MKEEYREEQFETLYCQAVAYRGSGLLWAARAVCLSGLVQLNMISSSDSETRIETIPMVSLLAKISLELGRLPDLLLSVLWFRSLGDSLPITDESKTHLDQKVTDTDGLLSCLVAGMNEDFLPLLSKLPDVLDALGLFMSKIILMYRLGWASELVDDGLMPADADNLELENLVNSAASQPANDSLPKRPRCNQKEPFAASTRILGVELSFLGGETEEDLLLCEAHLTAVESFFATAFTNKIWPKTEKLLIKIDRKSDIDEVKIQFNEILMEMTVAWPMTWSVSDVDVARRSGSKIIEFCVQVLVAIAVIPGGMETIEKMITEESLFDRTTSFCFAHFAQNRILGSNIVKFSDLDHLVSREYEIKYPVPQVNVIKLPENTDKDDEKQFSLPKSHSDYEVSSIINTHLWDKAGWQGLLYAHQGPLSQNPPIIGLIFTDRTMAEAIFRGWVDLIGSIDNDEIIRFALLRGIDKNNVHHYRTHISKNHESIPENSNQDRMFMSMSRLHTMKPSNSTNLDGFLELYHRIGAFYLIPAVMSSSGNPEMLTDLAILKRGLVVRDAWQVGRHDEDVIAVKNPQEVIIPDGVVDAPCLEILNSNFRTPK